jgi:23S rRNA (uracil1939-C5)-methyltransferase
LRCFFELNGLLLMRHPALLRIESVDLEGQGLARQEGKVFFIEDALLGEVVEAQITHDKPKYAKGRAVAWQRQSHQRVTPKCKHFGVCGGCVMQHMDPSAQLAIKQRAMEDSLWHIGRLKPEQILPPLDGPAWGYRTRARLTARFLEKKGGMLLGFHERKHSFIASMDSCDVLHPRVSAMVPAMKALLGSLSIAKRIPQVEVAVGEPHKRLNKSSITSITPVASEELTADASGPVIVWVLRILARLSASDEESLRRFADQWGVQFWLQPGSPTTAKLFYPQNAPELAYFLPEFNLRIPFSPVDFTQVNPAMNQVMVKRTVDLLDPQPGERVADLFCGLGNFTLAIAQRAGRVIGIEGLPSLIERAMRNAELHGLGERVDFGCANLFEVDAAWLADLGHIDQMLLDPPRDGALAVCQSLADLHQSGGPLPRRIVYVSCNPATLARDAAILVREGGWRLTKAGVLNMFPHTAHVESIAVFERNSE